MAIAGKDSIQLKIVSEWDRGGVLQDRSDQAHHIEYSHVTESAQATVHRLDGWRRRSGALVYDGDACVADRRNTPHYKHGYRFSWLQGP
jgi:hypothetical protein